jgi:tetratricopeptide (TPR) repeat protein
LDVRARPFPQTARAPVAKLALPFVAALAASCAAARRPPPAVEAAPKESAFAPDEEPRRYVSARAYQHVLEALLARGRDDHTKAVRELREALLYDPESAYLRTLFADELLAAGSLADAKRELLNALDVNPRYAPAHLLAARIALAQGHRDEARAEVRAAIAAAPGDPDAHRELVRLEIARGDLAAAATAAEEFGRAAEEASEGSAADETAADAWDETFRAARLRAQAAEAWLEVARALADQNDDEAAQEAFEHASALRPDGDEALAARAAFLASRGRFSEARALQLRLLSRRPDSPEVLAALARLSLAEGEMEVASAHVQKLRSLASALDPSAPEDDRREVANALFRIAIPLLGAHRPADAQSALDGALRLFPAHPELSFYRALALEQRARHREAAHAFEELQHSLLPVGGIGLRQPALNAATLAQSFLGIDQAQLVLDARVQAALAHGRAGQREEAARRLKTIFAEQPTDEGVALGLLEALERAGQAPEALGLLESAAVKHPDSPAILFARASALDRAGRVPEALTAMRKVMAVAPAHAGALNYVGYVMVEQGGDLREAEGLLRRAVQLRPDDGAIADSLGYCLLKQRRTDAALAELRRATRLSPGDPVVLGHFGDALLAAGRKDEAIDVFRRALSRLFPKSHPTAARHARAVDDDQEPRAPEPSDAKVGAELEAKLRSLTAP